MSPVEILAPAGDLEALKIAVWHGADAVYLAAKDFGMRSAPANFTFEELKIGVDFAHKHGCKVYQTVNILPTNSQADELEDFLRQSADVGVDALIVADVGVLMLAKRICPKLDVHISVQMGVVNWLTAIELHKLGASRVVLARELTLSEIQKIRSKIPKTLEIEAFVHGAICMSISGRCLISKYFVDRDANQGECAQPCRWEYDITDPRDPERKLNVVENMVKDKEGNIISRGSYILNSKDLCLIEHIPQLANAGVYSLKIEGRAKSSFYVASVVQAYKRAVDYYNSLSDEELQNSTTCCLPANIVNDVQKISHREYTTGFYFADVCADVSSNSNTNDKTDITKVQKKTNVNGYDPKKSPGSCFEKGYKQEWQPIAVKLEDGWHQRGKVQVGECVEVLMPTTCGNPSVCVTQSDKKQNIGQGKTQDQSIIDSITQVRINAIYALDDDKSRKNGKLLSEPRPLEASSHADQLLAFEFEQVLNTQINQNGQSDQTKHNGNMQNFDDILPFGTFLRAKN